MIDFPTSPVAGDTYTYGGRTWRFSGSAWERVINEGQLASVLVRVGPMVLTGANTFTLADSTWLGINYV